MANMDVDSQFCEPDSTVHIIVIEQPPPPTQLQVTQARYNDVRSLCAEMVQDMMRQRGEMRQRLADAKGGHERARSNWLMAQKFRQTTENALRNAEVRIAQIKDRCESLRRDIDAELNWQPTGVVANDNELQELRERLQHMQALLEAEVPLPAGP